MTGHAHIHRRHARAAALPDPFAFASAAAEALASAFPNPFADPDPTPAADANPQQTQVSIVYVTASKTFDGPIAGYTTMGPVVEPTTKAADPSTTPSPKAHHSSSTPETVAKSSKSAAQAQKSSDGLPESLLPTSSISGTVPILVATGGLSSITPSGTRSAVISAETSDSAKSTTTKSEGGMSTGGKAGLAIGILLLFGAVLALVLFFFKRRRDALKKERLDDEKSDVMFGSGPERMASTRTTATAPRLSLRPVTQFLPNLGGEKRQSRGNALALTPSSAAAQQPRQSPWERPMGGQDAARANPFGNHAEVIDAANANGPPVVNDVGPAGEIVSGSAAAVAGAAIGLARGASKRVPNQMDFTKGGQKGPFMGPPSPAGTEFSMSSDAPGTPAVTGGAAAIAAAGGPPNSTVHRVQLDFKPSMDDELELRAGQLIRLLHEYDDGWALCIRLDRSRQGVVPRTCLSTRPVKPRPQQNGPRGPPPPGMRVPNQQRPMSPAMNQGPPRAMSPAGNRPMTPNGQQGRPMTPQGRPMTPTGPQYNPQRVMTPNSQQGRPRSPSVAQMQDRRNSPPGPSPMNPVSGSPPNPSGPLHRKPVGQAM